MAKNKVIAGDRLGCNVSQAFGRAYLYTGLFKSIPLDKTTVESYELVNETHSKKFSNAAGRALVGGLLLGPAGAFAGALSSKNDAYLVALQFKDGTKSLVEVDEKIYKAIVQSLF